MAQTDIRVAEFLEKADLWQEEMSRLRALLLEGGLAETLKWGVPCYTVPEGNVATLGAFKTYCCLSFFKGALLTDPKGLLEKPGPNTQSARLFRFTSLGDIEEKADVIRAYIQEASALEKTGKKVAFKDVSAYEVPGELSAYLAQDPEFQKAFEALTPGRQKGYLLHFAAAKQAGTREARIRKYRPRILLGKGMYDCICGRSKKMPTCDGTHKSKP